MKINTWKFIKWYEIGFVIELFDMRYKKYGGHGHQLGKILKIFDYIDIGITLDFEVRYGHIWYDGQHHYLNIGFIYIAWGGLPYLDV